MSQNLFALDPKPKTILELYDGHPERWFQGTFFNNDKTACCLRGAMEVVYGQAFGGPAECKLVKTIRPSFATIAWFNDADSRTFDEILDLVRKAGV